MIKKIYRLLKKFADTIKNNKVIDYDNDSYQLNNVEPECNKLLVSSSTITTAIHLAAYIPLNI